MTRHFLLVFFGTDRGLYTVVNLEFKIKSLADWIRLYLKQ